jgi:hypothetical protein
MKSENETPEIIGNKSKTLMNKCGLPFPHSDEYDVATE